MPPPEDYLRVLVMADDHLARAGLVALLADQPGCTVAGQASGPEYATAAPEVYRADVVVWDLGWDTASGIEHLAEARDVGLPPTVALLPNEGYAAEARAAGARGLLQRDVDGATLLGALVAVDKGLAVLDPALEPQLPPFGGTDRSPSTAELTPWETDVLGLLAEGLPNKAIAVRLDISERTVKFHVNAILSKLGAQSRTEAVTRATRMGLITL